MYLKYELGWKIVLKIIVNFSFFIDILFWFLYRCNQCAFGCQTLELWNRHKSTNHRSEINNSSLVIPIVDLSRPGTTTKLRSLGITQYIPVSQMNNQGGQFGVPIVTSGKKANLLEAMNTSTYFSFGTIRNIQWKDCFEMASILVVIFAFYSIIAVLCILLQMYYVSTYSTLIWYDSNIKFDYVFFF